MYDLKSDPKQESNVISNHVKVAKELHQSLLGFMRETNVEDRLVKSRQELRV